MRELAVQAVNGTNNAQDRAALDAEVQQLKSEIDRTAKTTQFNSINLLDGSYQNKILQIGDKANQTLKIGIAGAKVSDLGLGTAAAGSNVFISGRMGFSANAATISSSFASAGSISLVINGTIVSAIKADTNTNGNLNLDINDVVTAINNSRAGVTASAFNEATAAYAGSGVLASADSMTITVTTIDDADSLVYTITNTTSMDDLVSKINAAGGAGTVQARVNDEGKLVLFNNTGADIETTTVSRNDGTSGLSASPATQSPLVPNPRPGRWLTAPSIPPWLPSVWCKSAACAAATPPAHLPVHLPRSTRTLTPMKELTSVTLPLNGYRVKSSLTVWTSTAPVRKPTRWPRKSP
jgi:flagellin